MRNADVVAIASDGEPRALVVNGRSLTDDDGALLGAVVAIGGPVPPATFTPSLNPPV